jgi:hypothetical protein
MDLALVGFRHGKEAKVFKVSGVDVSPKILGNSFAAKMQQYSSWLTNENNAFMFFSNIYQPVALNDDSYLVRRFLPQNKELIEKGDFGFLRFSAYGRGRGFRGSSGSPIVIPNDNEELKPQNITKYKWMYIYNFEYKRIEFYGKNFPRQEILPSAFEIPYFASININTASILNGLQKYYDVVEFLPRNHEQEIILQKSLNAEKPHKHSADRKKPKRSFTI